MGIKIKKGTVYTYEEIKDLFELAKNKTMKEPLDREIKEKMIAKDSKMEHQIETFEFMMGIESIILFDTLESNLFEKIEKPKEKIKVDNKYMRFVKGIWN